MKRSSATLSSMVEGKSSVPWRNIFDCYLRIQAGGTGHWEEVKARSTFDEGHVTGAGLQTATGNKALFQAKPTEVEEPPVQAMLAEADRAHDGKLARQPEPHLKQAATASPKQGKRPRTKRPRIESVRIRQSFQPRQF